MARNDQVREPSLWGHEYFSSGSLRGDASDDGSGEASSVDSRTLVVAAIVGVVLVALSLLAVSAAWFWCGCPVQRRGRRYKNVPPYESAFPGEELENPACFFIRCEDITIFFFAANLSMATASTAVSHPNQGGGGGPSSSLSTYAPPSSARASFNSFQSASTFRRNDSTNGSGGTLDAATLRKYQLHLLPMERRQR